MIWHTISEDDQVDPYVPLVAIIADIYLISLPSQGVANPMVSQEKE